MKRSFRWTAALLAVLLLLGMTAAAAGTKTETLAKGFYFANSGDLTVEPVTDSAVKRVNIGGTVYFYYPSSEKQQVSCAATAGKQYLVMLVTGTFTTVPTVSNEIIYIDQKEAAGSTVTFGEDGDFVFPNLTGIDNNQKLTLLVTSNDGTAMKKTEMFYSTGGSFDVEQGKKGDIDGNGSVNASDALMVLQIAAKLYTPTSAERAAADMDGNGGISASDALMVLQIAAHLISA